MADHVQPDAGEEREGASSGLLLSVDPLQGGKNYKLAGDDSDGSDKGGLLGDDSSDSDGSDSDSLLGGDDSDASDADGKDVGGSGDADSGDSLLGGDSDGSDSALGGDSDGSDASDADASDAGAVTGADSDSTDAQMNPLGIGDTNVDHAPMPDSTETA
jgi:hypothetical protein